MHYVFHIDGGLNDNILHLNVTLFNGKMYTCTEALDFLITSFWPTRSKEGYLRTTTLNIYNVLLFT